MNDFHLLLLAWGNLSAGGHRSPEGGGLIYRLAVVRRRNNHHHRPGRSVGRGDWVQVEFIKTSWPTSKHSLSRGEKLCGAFSNPCTSLQESSPEPEDHQLKLEEPERVVSSGLKITNSRRLVPCSDSSKYCRRWGRVGWSWVL